MKIEVTETELAVAAIAIMVALLMVCTMVERVGRAAVAMVDYKTTNTVTLREAR